MSPRAGDRDRALTTALAACAGGGWLAASLAVLDSIERGEAWVRPLLVLLWLVFAPLWHLRLAGWIGRLVRGSGAATFLAWALVIAPVALLPSERGASLLFGGLVLAQGALYLGAEDDRNAVFSLSAAPLLSVMALAYAPSRLQLALLPWNAIASVVALSLLTARSARRRVRRGVVAPEPPHGRRARLVAAIGIAAGLLVATLLVFTATERALRRTESTREAHLADLPPPTPPPPAGGGSARRPDGPTPGGHTEDLGFGGGTSPFSEAVVLRVAPDEGTRTRRALHLRHQVLDEFHALGVRSRRPDLPDLYFDGADPAGRDGWTWLDPGAASGRVETYRVHSRPLPVLDYGWTVLFSPAPVAAVELRRVRYHPDQLLAAPWVEREEFDYRVRVADRDASTGRLARARAGSADRRDLQLPPETPSLAALRTRAAELVRGAPNDLARVRAIVDHFHDQYAYARTGDDFLGTDALANLLVTRSGYCTLFSGAAALMLRTQGIPARVATGFVAHEWDTADGAWTVRERDAHAWIEVAFEGVGWVTFDPTPPAPDVAGGGFDPFADEESDALTGGLGSALERWADGQDGTLSEVLAALTAAAAALLRRAPSLWLLGIGGALALLAVWRARGPGARPGPGGTPRAPRLDPLVALQRHLVAELAAGGVPRGRGETLRELFTRAAARDARWSELPGAADLVYRARFGERPLADAELGALEGLVTRLRAERCAATT